MGGEWVETEAAVCREFGAALSLERLSLAPPAADEARIKIRACAVCHSDLIYMDGGWGGETPAVYGHEAAGIVAECGADAGVAVGERVLVTLLRSCGGCGFCAQGSPALCESAFDANSRLRDANGAPVAVGLKTGAFAAEVVAHRSQIAPMDSDLPFDEACLLSCGVLTGWGAVVNTAKVPRGAAVAVVGCGGVGANCLQGAALAGAMPVVAVDLSPEKLRQARQFGATDTVVVSAVGDGGGNGNGSDDRSDATSDAAKKARQLTGGRGFDFVFMAAGSGKAVELALRLVARRGALVIVGMPPNGDFARLNATSIADGERRILGSKMGGAQLPRDIATLLQLRREGKLKLQELIGNRFPFAQINDAITASRSGGALRNVIVFPE